MEKWETICSRCGLCCHEKVVFPEVLILDPERACEFYDKSTHLCSIYDNRFKKCNRCEKVGIFKVMFSPALPPTCAYVKKFEKLHLRFAHKREFVFSNLD